MVSGFVPPSVRAAEEAAELGFDEFMVANEETEGRPMHPESKENYYKDTPPQEHAALEAEQRLLVEEVARLMGEWESLEEQAQALRDEIEAQG